jgi:starvation-inducible outer membrane lipoprotein
MNKRGTITCLLVLTALLGSACTSATTGRRFEKMSANELMTYNRSVQFMEQVYCVEEVRTGSHVRRRHCETLYEIQERVAKSASAINILGTAQLY